MAGALLPAVKAFCEAPANPGLLERMALARKDERIDGWLALWPPGWKDFAGDAWQCMHKVFDAASADHRRALAMVLAAYVERLEAARHLATRPRQAPRGRRNPPSEPPKDAWWLKD